MAKTGLFLYCGIHHGTNNCPAFTIRAVNLVIASDTKTYVLGCVAKSKNGLHDGR